MYIRAVFSQDDREAQLDVIRENGWGCIVGTQDGVPFASHHPFLVQGEKGRERLDVHLARANPHWKTLAKGGNVLVVFQGPHTYVTPKWCNAERALPTWAYVAVHVEGRPKLVEAVDEVRAGQRRLVDYHEARLGTHWQMDSVEPDWIDGMLRAIVSFEIPIDRIAANFRLMQNRPPEDRLLVANALSAGDDAEAQRVGALMHRYSVDTAN